MRFTVLAVLSLALSATALAGNPPPPPPPQGASATAPGAIAGGKVTAFDATKKSLVVEANGQKITLDISKATVAGNVAVGAIVDVTHANGAASAVSVRGAGGAPPAGATAGTSTTAGAQTAVATGTAVASAPGAIAGAKVTAFDAAKKIMVVDVNGQKVEVNVANATIAGQIAVGKVVDVTHSNNVASSVAVRP